MIDPTIGGMFKEKAVPSKRAVRLICPKCDRYTNPLPPKEEAVHQTTIESDFVLAGAMVGLVLMVWVLYVRPIRFMLRLRRRILHEVLHVQ
jgi:hypothetical protein